MANETLLELQEVFADYGKGKALEGIDLSVGIGQIVALMGPNGAGKSTILKVIFGLMPVKSGRILWQGNPIVSVSHRMVQMGVAFVPQGRRVFSHLTVEENLEMGGFALKDKKELERRKVEAMEIFPVLGAKRKLKSGTLSGGEQQMLALARGLMTHPKLLLLDEPTLGLAPKVTREVFEWIRSINGKYGTAFLIVEHNTASLLSVADKVYVIDKGRVISSATLT